MVFELLSYVYKPDFAGDHVAGQECPLRGRLRLPVFDGRPDTFNRRGDPVGQNGNATLYMKI